MDYEELLYIIKRRPRLKEAQWRQIRVMAEEYGIPCNGRGCGNYKHDVAIQVALKMRENGKREEKT